MTDYQNEYQHTGKFSRTAPIIGFFVSNLSFSYHYAMLCGITNIAYQQGFNILCFPGNPINSPELMEKPANVVYELAGPKILGGLIISGSLTVFDKNQYFFDRYRSLPIAVMVMELDGVPCVRINNDQGFRALLTHLIKDHNYRRLAYLGGPMPNMDSERRYQIYQEVLAEYGIPFNPDLVTSGQFHLPSSGNDAIRLLIDKRKVQFDAIVAANDTMAMGVLIELQDRGIKVPDDIAVTGFDDQEWAKYCLSPLTTVRQSAYDLGQCGARLLIAQLKGEEVPAEVFLPTELVIRNSCGCFSESITQAAIDDIKITMGQLNGPIVNNLQLWSKLVVTEMLQVFNVDQLREIPDWADQLMDAFIFDIQGITNQAFLKSLDLILQKLVFDGADISPWQNVISAMQRYGTSYFGAKALLYRAENIWHQARLMIGETMIQLELHRSHLVFEQAYTLRRISTGVQTTFNLSQLMEAIYKFLPRLGIYTGYLSLYEGIRRLNGRSKLILAFRDRKWIPVPQEGLLFPTEDFIPVDFFSQHKRFCLGTFPLYFGEEQLGYIIYDVNMIGRYIYDPYTYDTLRAIISSALKGALLVEKLEEKEHLLEEWTTALTFANNELNQIASVALNILQEPLQTVIRSLESIEQRYKGKLDSTADEFIGFATDGAVRMHELINDLLTYSQVGNQAKPFEKVNIAMTMNQVYQNLKVAIEEHHAKITLDPMPEIWGDPGQILQLFQNLIGNAIKFHGESPPEVHISAERENDGWLFIIRDNGIGIDMQYANRIFLIFQRLHSKEEYPGTGIGLSICKKIVERHSGCIWVNSTPGKGCTFYFTILI
jgi:DNA-binding LacI/PurR family transcriptional regulator/signal transduction histidine kinase